MVSVLLLNIGRPEMAPLTMPKWLAQEGVEFEIIYGHGPAVPVPLDPRIKPVLFEKFAMAKCYNRLLEGAKGEFILISQSDMEVNDTRQIAKMLEAWKPGYMVTERFIKNDQRDAGIFIQFMLIRREDFIRAGGWCEEYDSPDLYGCEDSDVVCRLIKSGMKYKILESPDDTAVRHIWHPSPDLSDPVVRAKIDRARELLFRRQGGGIYGIFAREFARMMMEKRRGL